MPLKRTPPEPNTFLVIFTENERPYWHEYVGFKNAVNGYRYMRQLHGDNVRLVKVIVDYGTQI